MGKYPAEVRAMIPQGVHGEYRQRRLRGGVPDLGLLEYAQDMHINVLMEGPTGSGKTMLPMAYAEHFDQPYYSIDCNGGVDPTQIYGRHVQDSERKWEFRYGGLPTIVTWGGVLVIEEINMMPPKLAAMLYSLLDARRMIRMTYNLGEIIRADQPWDPNDESAGFRDLLIVATYNEGYRGTYGLNEALRNRFGLTLDWGYDKSVESKLLFSETLREIADQVRDGLGSDYITPMSTNRLVTFEQFVADISLDFAIDNLVASFAAHERASLQEQFKLNHSRLAQDYAKTLSNDLTRGDAWEEMAWDAEDGGDQ